MDWHKLQQTLFEIDPSDPNEDLSKLQEQAQGGSRVVDPTKNYVTESVDVPEGTMPLKIDSISDFAALAGIRIDESQKPADQVRGSEFMPKAKPGRTKHPMQDRLVGEGPLDTAKAAISRTKAGFAAGKASPAGLDAAKSAYRGEYEPNNKSSSEKNQSNTKPSGKPTNTFRIANKMNSSNPQLLSQAIARLQSDQPLSRSHYNIMGEAFKNIINMDRKQLMSLSQVLSQGKTESTDTEYNSIKEELYRRLNSKK